MFGSSMLDIAIGVVFIFLLLSVFATTINELILSFLNMRGRQLLRGIQTLLSDHTVTLKDPDAETTGLVHKIYTHGQVYGLFDGPFDTTNHSNLPSYIPARNFALAFIDSIEQAAADLEKQTATAVAQGGPGLSIQAAQAAQASAVPPFEQATPPAPVAGAVAIAPAFQQTVLITQAFKTAATTLAANKHTAKVGKPLVSMIALAGDDATKLQKSVEEWFNSGMDRVSGWYKHKTQTWLFFIGLTMAIAVNADTISIVRQLSKDSTLRQSIVAAANATHDPASPSGTTTPPQPNAGQTVGNTVGEAAKSFDNIRNLGIPLGWPPPGDTTISWPSRTANCLHWIVWDNPSMLLGWFFTAVAISLGAPFWFDALNKIMVVRSTVKPREKSHDEGSKDKPKD